MTWDKDKPAGTDKLRDSDDMIRANWSALEDAIGRNHNFPGDEGVDAGEHTVVELQDQAGDPETPADIISLYNNANELFYRLQNNGDIIPVQTFPSGTKLLFPQPAAPTGWTFVAENNDRVLINQDIEANGGTTAGSWTISGVTVDGHQLTTAEMPSHTHPTGKTSFGDSVPYETYLLQTAPYTGSTQSTGGDQQHNHGLTADGDWRPAYLGVITCTKD